MNTKKMKKDEALKLVQEHGYNLELVQKKTQNKTQVHCLLNII